MSSRFINFIFNTFVISYWMYFVLIERKKELRKKIQSVVFKIQNPSKGIKNNFEIILNGVTNLAIT